MPACISGFSFPAGNDGHSALVVLDACVLANSSQRRTEVRRRVGQWDCQVVGWPPRTSWTSIVGAPVIPVGIAVTPAIWVRSGNAVAEAVCVAGGLYP